MTIQQMQASKEKHILKDIIRINLKNNIARNAIVHVK